MEEFEISTPKHVEQGEIDTESSRRSTEEQASQRGGSTRRMVQERRPSLLSLAFIRKATAPTNISSVDVRLWQRVVYDGVLFDHNKQRFWVDKKLNKNCLMVFPEGMTVTHSDDDRYWRRINEKVECFGGPLDVSILELVKVSWLSISGTLWTTDLSLKTTYEVSMLVKLSEACKDWPLPVNVCVTLPDGSVLGRLYNLTEQPKGTWINLVAGEFVTDSKNLGKISYFLKETSQIFKKGFAIKGLLFQPKD